MLLHGSQPPSHTLDANTHALEADQHHHNQQYQQARQLRRKRKAESQDNERLSKRLSLLNLEKHGQRLYVPVENPTTSFPASDAVSSPPSSASTAPLGHRRRGERKPPPLADEVMQLDDSKHKVYIYDIEDELSSSESEADDGKLVFLPDIEKHLRANRIPPSVLANDRGELAGMQMVLYNEPTSLTVPREQDSVRKAIVEARARMRERQRLEREGNTGPVQLLPPFVSQEAVPTTTVDMFNAVQTMAPAGYEPDAMEVDS